MRLVLTIVVLGFVPYILLRKMGRNGRGTLACACKAGRTSA
jgi:hypothetical protein